MDSNSLYYSFLSDKRLKSIKTVVPFNKDFSLVDISIKDRNNEEDIYKADPELINKLHRGTSFLVHNDQVYWARKGQKKFFEVKENSIIPFQLTADKTCWKLLKVNGENAQISYSPEIDSWILASKNVSLAARTEQDFLLYNGLRFNFAKMIGSAWFSMIKNFTEAELVNLKRGLTGFTMVGEYVGNPDCQHIIKYNNISIEFFSLVENQGFSYCCSSDFSKEFFQKFKLNSVECEKVELFQENKKFQETVTSVQDLSIEAGQEGSVFYFSENKETIWMCKVKTLEYKVMRKLREYMKRFDNEKSFQFLSKYINRQEKKKGRSLQGLLIKAEQVLKDICSTALNIQNNFASMISESSSQQVFFSIGPPGIGKSFLISKLKSFLPSLSVISSDHIRSQQMQIIKNKNSNLSLDELFSRAAKPSQQLFDSLMKTCTFPLYVDKNIPPNGLSILISNLTSNFTDANLSFIGFYQKSQGLQINQKFWPLSLEVLYTCLQRVIIRDDNPTLGSHDAVKACQITILMFNLYQGIRPRWYLDHGVQKIVPVNFVNEEKVRVPEEFREKILKVLEGLKIGKGPDAQQANEILLTIQKDRLEYEEVKIGEVLPLFIGIEVDLPVISFVVKALNEIFQIYPTNTLIEDDLKDISSLPVNSKPLKPSSLGWSIPKTLHITLLYIGENSKVLHSHHYKSFQTHKEYFFSISHFVYCPQKLFIAIIKFIEDEPLVSNKVPHITMLSRKVSNKLSNDVLENLELNEKVSVQSCIFGDCFCIPAEFGRFSGVSKEFY